ITWTGASRSSHRNETVRVRAANRSDHRAASGRIGCRVTCVSEREEDDLDEALEQTFPASDPLANTVETGIGIALQPGDVVYDNREAGRFEITVDGELAFLQYDRK